LALPGLINDLKYLPAHRDPAQAIAWLQQFVVENVAQRQQKTAMLVLMSVVGVVALMSNGQE